MSRAYNMRRTSKLTNMQIVAQIAAIETRASLDEARGLLKDAERRREKARAYRRELDERGRDSQ